MDILEGLTYSQKGSSHNLRYLIERVSADLTKETDIDKLTHATNILNHLPH